MALDFHPYVSPACFQVFLTSPLQYKSKEGYHFLFMDGLNANSEPMRS